jgi:hypothetical protein
MNLWTKQQSNTSMDTAIHHSLYLALMQISHKFAKDLIQHPVGNFKDSAKSKTTLNKKIVSWLIVDCGRMLEDDDREEIPTRFLWQHAKAARARFEEEAKEGRRNEDMIPIDSRDDLKSVLEILLGDGNIESVDLPKLLLVESRKLWKSYLAPRESELKKETILRERDVRASCSSLVLKLLATKILTPTKVDLKSNERPSVVLRWGRRENNGRIELAYRSAIGWDNIPESTHLSNNY